MEELTPEVWSVYMLLHGKSNELINRKLSSLVDILTKSISAKFDLAEKKFIVQINDMCDETSFPTGSTPEVGTSSSTPPSPTVATTPPAPPDVLSAADAFSGFVSNSNGAI